MEKRGITLDDVSEFFDALEAGETYNKSSPHGKVVDYRFEPYHDVTVYEDGYEDWFYIGD